MGIRYCDRVVKEQLTSLFDVGCMQVPLYAAEVPRVHEKSIIEAWASKPCLVSKKTSYVWSKGLTTSLVLFSKTKSLPPSLYPLPSSLPAFVPPSFPILSFFHVLSLHPTSLSPFLLLSLFFLPSPPSFHLFSPSLHPPIPSFFLPLFFPSFFYFLSPLLSSFSSFMSYLKLKYSKSPQHPFPELHPNHFLLWVCYVLILTFTVSELRCYWPWACHLCSTQLCFNDCFAMR